MAYNILLTCDRDPYLVQLGGQQRAVVKLVHVQVVPRFSMPSISVRRTLTVCGMSSLISCVSLP